MKGIRLLAVALVVVLAAVFAWTWIGGSGTGGGTGVPAAGGDPEVPDGGDLPEETGGTLPRAMVTVVPTLDDRVTSEPCNVTGVGGLYSVTALLDEMRDYAPTVGVLMGNVSNARGAVGADHVKALCGLLLPYAHAQIMCPGEAELGPGAQFVREHLLAATRDAVEVIACNVTDGNGTPLLKGTQLTEVKANPPADPTPRNVLFVSVLADSMQARLDARGSDIVVQPAREAVTRTLQEALASWRASGRKVHNRVLLVQGTVADAEELIDPEWEFDFAVASLGGVLPQREPPVVGTTPIYFGGRGARFAWRVILGAGEPDSVNGYLVRLGQSLLARGSPLHEIWANSRDTMLAGEVRRSIAAGRRFLDRRGRYVGSASCDGCHAEEAADHDASPHARGRPDLPVFNGCAKCHATGFDAEGGWDPGDGKATARPARVDCEACHGPAERHLADPAQPYGAFDRSRCTICHLPDHSPGFDPDDLWKRFGHRLRPSER